MADISKIKIKSNDGTTYNIKDASAYRLDDIVDTTINNADTIPFYDISATAKKKITWENAKSVLKTYFDGLYNKYVLPTASTSTLGGVKVDGTSVTIDVNGVISSNGGSGGGDKVNKTDVAPIESGNTASRAYSVGQQFYYNGILYIAKTPIAQGATFTVGTNCESANDLTTQIFNAQSGFPPLTEMITPTVVNNRVTEVVGGYKQVGKTVYVYVYGLINQTMDSSGTHYPTQDNWSLFSGLPTAKKTTPLQLAIRNRGNNVSVASSAMIVGGADILSARISDVKLEGGWEISYQGLYETN